MKSPKDVQYVSEALAREIMRQTAGQFFTVAFERRRDSRTDPSVKAGDLRVMNCRIGVTYDLKGGPAAYDPRDHDLFWVYDVKAKTANKRRSVDMRSLRWIKAGGKLYVVVH